MKVWTNHQKVKTKLIRSDTCLTSKKARRVGRKRNNVNETMINGFNENNCTMIRLVLAYIHNAAHVRLLFSSFNEAFNTYCYTYNNT